ncbi:GNAT family N-acetyltransferase [Cellulomonas shaoxiangyii]|uniref:GNAT family N-acetyltransferase n=1 Tax=Cellulomonas shaoxiangyii TaxID=2566013 RepID=UPI001FB60330|nr:GNAT family N-acetyltransferase [Cellulomonas shaoxiangyii]
MRGPGAGVVVEPARPDDVGAILALRTSLEEWMETAGVVQWPRGSLPRARVEAQLAAGEWHVVRGAPGEVVGTLRLLWADPEFWGADDTPAVYVHGLMTARSRRGTGLGRTLLDWAAERGRAAGVGLFRLDCRDTNPVLRRYYERYGFAVVGRRDFPLFSATLLQKPLDGV